MIIRILSDDQYEIAGDDYTTLNDLDDAVVEAVDAGDADEYEKRFAALIAYIQSNGTKLADDDLRDSDVIVPPEDIHFDEAPHYFSGEGVIPDSVLPGSE